MDNLKFLTNLFIDPSTETVNSANNQPVPYPYILFMVLIGLTFLAWLYYSNEGRKKIPFIRDNRVWKNVFDRMVGFGLALPGQFPVWGFVGLFVIGFYRAFDTSFFAWRIWTALWLAWGVGLVVYWVVYFFRKHPRVMAAHERHAEKARFLPSK